MLKSIVIWPFRLSLTKYMCLLLKDLLTLDVTKLTPLSPEVISRQATINIGTYALIGR